MTGQETRRGRVRGDELSPFWYHTGELVVGWLLRFYVRRYRAFGAERLPKYGGLFVVANHTTGMDPFLVGYPLRRRLPRGPGKEELFRFAPAGWLMRRIGIFPINNEVADAYAVRTMVELYRRGNVVIVFPEGGRSATDEMKPFLPGFARLIIKLKAPILPAGVAGGADLMPIGQYFPRPNRAVATVYGEPFELSAYYDRPMTDELAQEAAEDLRGRIAALVEQARQERARL